MSEDYQNAVMRRGDVRAIVITVVDKGGNPVGGLDAATVEWRLALTEGGAAVLEKSTANGGVTYGGDTPAGASQFVIALTPADTDALDAARYFHAARITDEEGNPMVTTVGYLSLRDRPRTPAV